MDEFTVDVAVEADLDGLVASVQGLFIEDGGRHDPLMDTTWPAREGAAYYASVLADPACLLLVAHQAGRVVGHLVGKLAEPDSLRTARVAVLESMRVAADRRGAGIGTLLVDEFFRWASDRAAAEASVTAFAANDGARHFYRRHGFAPRSTTFRAAL